MQDEMDYAAGLDMEDLEAIVFDYADAETVDGCIVEPDGKCPHGYSSPLLLLGLI